MILEIVVKGELAHLSLLLVEEARLVVVFVQTILVEHLPEARFRSLLRGAGRI